MAPSADADATLSNASSSSPAPTKLKCINLNGLMNTAADNAEIAGRFAGIANRFCSVVDSASSMERSDLLLEVYRTLPKLIDEAISLPDVKPGDSEDPIKRSVRQGVQEWSELYNLLKEKLGDWDRYWQVFDPTEDDEAIFGSLADDIADTYRDLKKGLVLIEAHGVPPEDTIWNWRILFYSHWGKHSMDALIAIHFRLQNAAS